MYTYGPGAGGVDKGNCAVGSSRYVYTRVVVDGVHLGTIDTVAGHYQPYTNSGRVNYSVKLG